MRSKLYQVNTSLNEINKHPLLARKTRFKYSKAKRESMKSEQAKLQNAKTRINFELFILGENI